MIAGQFLDVSVQARGRADVDTAMTVLRYKSAKYSIERPIHIGAALAGATPGQLEQLGRFGLPLGEAFQLRDDLLGVFGDPAETGKPAGDDLVEGKRTVLVALALDAAPRAAAERLDAALGTSLTATDVDELRGIIDDSGARAQVEAVIGQLSEHAVEALRASRRSTRTRATCSSSWRQRRPSARSEPVWPQSRLVTPGTTGPSPRSSTVNGTPRSSLTREPSTLRAMLKAFSSARASVDQPSHSRTTPSRPLPMSWRQSARASKFCP